MVIGKGGHEVVAVVILWLHPKLDASLLVYPGLLCSGDEILWQELLLLVEVVSGALFCSQPDSMKETRYSRALTTSMSASSGPRFHFFTSSVASCSAHFALFP